MMGGTCTPALQIEKKLTLGTFQPPPLNCIQLYPLEFLQVQNQPK